MKWCLALRKRFNALKEIAVNFKKAEGEEIKENSKPDEDDDQPQPKRVRLSRKQSTANLSAASGATTAAATAARPT